MKKSILSVILIASGLLSGCSSEESVSRPEIIGQTGTLTFSFPAPRRSVTYADGTPDDSGPLAATEDEAEINDVSIYMFEDETGGLLVAKKTASGDEITGRSVTFDVNDFITNGANYVFYAVANVSANITDDFVVGSTTLNYFTSAVATATGTDPNQGRNMLMAGFVSIGNLSAQTDPVQTINLRHRVARFDIDNLTADDDPANDNMEPGSGGNVAETFFEITKIHVKNTLSSGYLTEENNGQERPDPAAKVSLTGDDAIVVSGLDNINNGLVKSAFYLWPGELAAKTDTEVPGSTFIQVEGVYVGNNTPRLFTVQLDTPKPVQANRRYTLTVSRISQTTLTFALKVSDWEEGDGVQATPPAGAFEYSGFALNGNPLSTDNIDLSNNTGISELTFYTEGESKATEVLTATLDLTLGQSYKDSVSIETVGSPAVTYSLGKVRQDYKVTLKKTTYPVAGTLTIKDEKTNISKVFNITSVPVYNNTVYKPVLVGSKYWAPVNVGATSTTYSATEAGCGHYFQWGRSYAKFIYGSENDLVEGPVSAGDAYGIYATMFIISAGDWLNSGDKDDYLWSGDNAQGPCPNGWRVPTSGELNVLSGKHIPANFVEGRLLIPHDEGQSGDDLYLPGTGFRNSDGTWVELGGNGRYWSSSVSDDVAIRFSFYRESKSVFTTNRASALTVRCIQK